MPQDTEAGVRVVLEGALTMRTADIIHARLRETIDADATFISIDCSAATEVDLTFVQLLIASRLSAEVRGKSVVLAASPDGVLLDALNRGGFEVVDGPAETPAFWFQGVAA